MKSRHSGRHNRGRIAQPLAVSQDMIEESSCGTLTIISTLIGDCCGKR